LFKQITDYFEYFNYKETTEPKVLQIAGTLITKGSEFVNKPEDICPQ